MPSAVAFYLVAHLDDWQLFMNPNAVWDLQEPTNRVVMIYLTADDAGGNDVYWHAKEEAGIASARYGIGHLGPLNEVRSTATMSGHITHRWSGGNAVAYFLRLPDGATSGLGYGHGSLSQLQRGDIATLSAMDGSTRYAGWPDLVDTLQAIVDHESAGVGSISIDHPDTDERVNPHDHPDHQMAGLAVQAMPRYASYRRYAHLGYHLQSTTPTLAGDELFWKIGQFVAYDKALYDATGYSTVGTEPDPNKSFLFRAATVRQIT